MFFFLCCFIAVSAVLGSAIYGPWARSSLWRFWTCPGTALWISGMELCCLSLPQPSMLVLCLPWLRSTGGLSSTRAIEVNGLQQAAGSPALARSSKRLPTHATVTQAGWDWGMQYFRLHRALKQGIYLDVVHLCLYMYLGITFCFAFLKLCQEVENFCPKGF